MYNLNNLQRNVLITPNEVIKHAPTKHTLDIRSIEHSIIIAEERFIRPELEYLFYSSIANEKNKLITADNIEQYQVQFSNYTLKEGDIINAYEFLSDPNLLLWKEHLWKLIAEAVMIIATPEAYIQFGTQGVMHTVAPASPMGGGDAAVGPDLRAVKWIMDQKQYRIDPLIQSMKDYLCRARTNYPLYYPLYTKECPCDNKSNESKRSDVILGLYDEPKSCGCR